MKSNLHFKTIILIALLGVLAYSYIINNDLNIALNNSDNISEYCEQINVGDEHLTTSAISGKIHINNNWSAVKASGICTGAGTYSDPYVIQDLIIDGGGAGSCILIENSGSYFRIQNCNIYNAGVSFDAGIRLIRTNNSLIINNKVNDNGWIGILLNASHNNTVSGNTVDNNDLRGIELHESHNNNVSGNSISSNLQFGIFLFKSHNNKVTGNSVSFNIESGIELSKSHNNYISGNKLINNIYSAIYLSSSHNNKFLGNELTRHIFTGICLSFSHNNTFLGNFVHKFKLGPTNKAIRGFKILSSNNNIISNNTVNTNYIGIFIDNSQNNTLLGNLMDGCGFKIEGTLEDRMSNNIEISNLINGKRLYFYTNEIGLKPQNFANAGQVNLINVSNSLISNLNVSYGFVGISLYHCNNITVSENTANNNNNNGISIGSSHNNSILGNTASNNNNNGISLGSSHNNVILGNTANNNSDNGVKLTSSNNNIIRGNYLIENSNGWKEIDCEGNIFQNNMIGKELVVSGYNIFFLMGVIYIISIIIMKELKSK